LSSFSIQCFRTASRATCIAVLNVPPALARSTGSQTIGHVALAAKRLVAEESEQEQRTAVHEVCIVPKVSSVTISSVNLTH
jgi:hypothetical protein